MTRIDPAQPWKTGSSQLATGILMSRRFTDERIASNRTAQGLQRYIESSQQDAHSQPTGSVWFVLKDEDIYTVVQSESRQALAQRS